MIAFSPLRRSDNSGDKLSKDSFNDSNYGIKIGNTLDLVFIINNFTDLGDKGSRGSKVQWFKVIST